MVVRLSGTREGDSKTGPQCNFDGIPVLSIFLVPTNLSTCSSKWLETTRVAGWAPTMPVERNSSHARNKE
jgi:hypothetical protein